MESLSELIRDRFNIDKEKLKLKIQKKASTTPCSLNTVAYVFLKKVKTLKALGLKIEL